MTARPRLHAVEEPVKQTPPSYSYESEERRRIAAKDWAAIHVRGDRGPVLPFYHRSGRTWAR